MKPWSEKQHDKYFKERYGGLFDDDAEIEDAKKKEDKKEWKKQLQKMREQGGHP